MALTTGTRLGPYEIQAPLGAGGMGEVYKATDTRLDRTVAIKVLPEHVAADPGLKRRLEREARAASSLNHPNICALYDIGQQAGVTFLVMEHLEGETLGERIARGALPLTDTVQHGLALLATLETLHDRGLVHRDLKPSNVFLTPHGLKLLDFGLARPVRSDADATVDLTQPGTVLGTPRYMAPEVLRGEAADARADIFAVGAMLYEMLSGKPAFEGHSAVEIAHAVMHDKPPVLTGSAAIVSADRVIHRALAKRVDERYQSAALMARDLRDVLTASDAAETVTAHQVPRLIVLPFRMLRPDDDTEFLAFSLPDAITSSLSGLQSLVVRSSLAAGTFASATPDLKALAEEAEVDVALIGTLLRAGDRLRVKAQLLEVPAGTVLWSHSGQVTLQDLFQLEDELTRRIVESLSLPLTTRGHERLGRDAPASAAAYEYYLRANQLSFEMDQWPVARDLYLQCVERDPQYAPAWARLGRIHRVIAKAYEPERPEAYRDGLARAESAFRRALDLNPDLAIAHNLYTGLEVEQGRAQDAMVRLLARAKTRGADPELFAGLVMACRYCGLLAASVAAHEHARHLDPAIPTSVIYTLFAAGDYEAVVETGHSVPIDAAVTALGLTKLERRAEAAEVLKQAEPAVQVSPFWRAVYALHKKVVDGRPDQELAADVRAADVQRSFDLVTGVEWDPEGFFWGAIWASRAGDLDRAATLIDRAVTHGFICYPWMVREPWLDPMRNRPDFVRVLALAKTHHDVARDAFRRAGGERVLGVQA